VSNNNSDQSDIQTKTHGNKKRKAVALLSGGLDSNLAVRMMQEQGIAVEAVAIKTPFCDFDCGKGCGHRVKEVATELGIELKTIYLGEEYLRMLKRPKYGYGSGMNPCIDCRSMMYRAAKEHMERVDADFIITGEVLFQRPMSQNNRALHIIEEETGTTGRVLRPLSAKHLPPIEVEKNGIVKREDLEDIKGRSRKRQLALARHFNISEPPNSAGGCLLTDPAFSKRVRDIIEYTEDIPSINDVELLKVGRHFRLSKVAKLVVGRNRDENEIIDSLVLENDIVLETKGYTGPRCILRSKNCSDTTIEKAAKIVLRYSDAPKKEVSTVKVIIHGKEEEILTSPINEEELKTLRI
jgi:tRNA-uridine 2-sulfurtransferase